MRKGQAAMEFLMTYGWAILVVLAAIGALAYFGVLNPGNFLPEKCALPSGMACIDFRQDSNDTIQVIIQNSMGYDISQMNASIVNDGVECISTQADLEDGDKTLFEMTCGTELTKGKFSSPLTVRYYIQASDMYHIKTGQLILKVE